MVLRLPEYRSKEIFQNYGIRIPSGTVVTKDAYKAGTIDYNALPVPAVVKAQNLIGGRCKTGGIKFAANAEALRTSVESLFEYGFSGNEIETLLIEEQVDIEKEAYLSFSIDRRAGNFAVMASGNGGIEIESANVAAMRSAGISNLIGLQKFQASYVGKTLVQANANPDAVRDMIARLYRILKEEHALLVEINPLVIQKDGSLLAVDAKIILDDNIVKVSNRVVSHKHGTPLQQAGAELGVNMVELDGEIAVISNGAGEGMTTLDQIVHAGGALSLWVDLGGSALSAKPEVLNNFIERVMDTEPKVLLFTAFFQIGKCDLFAESFREIYYKRKKQAGAHLPQIILRLDGRNAKEAKTYAEGTNMLILDSSQQACETAVRLSKGGE